MGIDFSLFNTSLRNSTTLSTGIALYASCLNFLSQQSQNLCPTNPLSFSSQALPRLVQRSVVTEANNNIVDHGYTPYSLNDYRKLQKEVKLGGLGANIGGKEWRERARRRIKI